MTKEEIKQILEEYKYETQFYNEKIKDVNKLQYEISKLAENNKIFRMSELNTAEIDRNFSLFLKRQAKEESQLLIILDKKQKIEDYINMSPQPYRVIFYLKYISLLTFDQIAYKLNYSTKRIYQLHNEGLDIIIKKINETLEECEDQKIKIFS